MPLDKLGADYDVDDLLPAIRAGLSLDGKLYAAPFYGESSFVMYRTDLMEKAGLKMPEKPTWEFIKQAADKMTDKAAGVYGICLRGKPGWGENMAFLTATANSFGARWFDEKWQPQFNSPEWKATLDYLRPADEGGRPSRRVVERLQREPRAVQRRQVRHVDRRHRRGGFVTDPKQSKVADKVGFALAPDNGLGKRGNWLWAWSLAVPAGSSKVDAAQKFISWATSKHYTDLVASKEGWAARSAGHAHLALQERGLPEGGAVRRADAGVRSTRPIRCIRP